MHLCIQKGDIGFSKAESFRSSELQAKLLVEPINSSHIERKLLDTYPGVSKVLDDSQDENPLDRCRKTRVKL